MAATNLIGRKKEQEQLDIMMNSGRAEFVVVYGRRRVGKTFLVNKYFKDKFTFKYTGDEVLARALPPNTKIHRRASAQN